MPQADTRTIEQVVEPLALLEGPCPCVARGGSVCVACAPRPDSRVVIHGAACLNKCSEEGQVAEFPMLREPCRNCHGRRYVLDHKDKLVCTYCQGRGWLLVTTTEALLEAIQAAGYPTVVIHRFEDGMYMVKLGYSVKDPEGSSKDRRLALARALCAAKGIEVK